MMFKNNLEPTNIYQDNYYSFFQQAENEFYNNFKMGVLAHNILLNQHPRSKYNYKDKQSAYTLPHEEKLDPNIGIWNYDKDNGRVAWSDEVNQIFGLAPGTSPSPDLLKAIIHPGDRQWVMELFNSHKQKEEGISMSFRILNGAGEIKFLFAQSKLVIDDHGKPVGIFGILHDITQKKKIEAENARLLHVIKHSRDEIYLFSTSSFKFEFLNAGALSNSGYSMEEMIHMTPVDIKPEFTKADFQKMVKPLLDKKQERLVFETIHCRKDGTCYPVEVRLQLMEQDTGDLFMAIVLDITERKKAEKEIQRGQELLEYQNTQLVDFCNIVSHNLRSPLANMFMLIEAIEESEDEEEKRLYISKLKPVIGNLHETFDELVESLQVRQDLKIQSEEILLDETVSKQLDSFEGQISSWGATLEMDFTEAPIVRYPVKYLSSILHNLISNALKYRSLERQPRISIKTIRKNRSVILSVKDNGMGLDLDKYKNKIFKIRKVFHNNPDAKGFGLFLTKTQVEAMGGKIWVESSPGIGSTFFIEFADQF